MKFSVMITTRNRCADLRRTCERISLLKPPPDQVLICADGSSDETSNMIRREFPNFLLIENESSLGSVASRDRLLRAATGDIVLSLDADSYPLARGFLSTPASSPPPHPYAPAPSS